MSEASGAPGWVGRRIGRPVLALAAALAVWACGGSSDGGLAVSASFVPTEGELMVGELTLELVGLCLDPDDGGLIGEVAEAGAAPIGDLGGSFDEDELFLDLDLDDGTSWELELDWFEEQGRTSAEGVALGPTGEVDARLQAEGRTPVCNPDPLRIAIAGPRAEIRGLIGSDVVARLSELIEDHPEVDTLVLVEVPGSIDDEANLAAMALVREAGLATLVPANGEIASGGVDLFLAGERRRVEPGARLGVHSWGSADGVQGAELDSDHPDHRPYLEVFDRLGVDPDFYWFTLEAAPAEGIHWMSPVEIERYGLETG